MANKKFLDFEGVRHLWSKINMQDYPNNDMLMNVIQAIDDTKLDKDALTGSNEINWDGVTLDNIQVGWFMHLVSYDIPDGFLFVENGNYAWNNTPGGDRIELTRFEGVDYIGLYVSDNPLPDEISDFVALAVLEENTEVFGTVFDTPGFYLSADTDYGEYVSSLHYEWNLLNQKVNAEDLMDILSFLNDTKADRDELLQNANLTDAEAYDLRYKLRLPDTKQFYYVGDMSSGTDFVSGFMCSLKEEQVEKAKSIPAVHYPNIHPNALSELISSCNMAMGKETSSINYKIILPRIIDNFEKLYENEVITSSFLEISFYEITKYTGQIGSLAEMSLLKQGDESFLLYRRPDMGFLNFKGNVVLENHMATLDTTLTDPYIPPSSEAVGVALDLKADRNELLQNKEEITNQESYELQFKLRLPSVKEYVYTGDNTSGVSPTGSMCSKFSGIEQAMGVPAAYSSTAPNALAELIGGCMTACSNTPDSMIYSNILPRITLNFPNLVAAGAWRNGITLTVYDISGYSRTSGDKITFFIKYDSETDEYTLRRRSPSWGVLVFNSQNVVLLNQMSKFDDTLTDPNRSPSAAAVGEALSNNIETITTHTSNEAIHVTAEEKEAWNSAAATVSNLNQGLVLTDTVTGTNYRVTVAKGKVTLVEVSE